MNNLVAKIYIVLLFLAVYVVSVDPIDLKAGQWLNLSIINPFFLLYILARGSSENILNSFKNNFVKYFGLFFVVACLSSIWAINPTESLVRLTDLFIILSTLFIVTFLKINSKINLSLILSLITFSLFIDLFGTLNQYRLIAISDGFDFSLANEIRGFYANKNITAVAIAFKIPFVIFYLRNFNNRFIKLVLLILISSAFFSLFLISARAVFVSVSLCLLFISFIYSIKAFSNKSVYLLKPLYAFVFPLIIAFLSFQILEGSEADRLSVDSRIDSIINNQNDESTTQRLRFYSSALESIASRPLLGCGIGNWKILLTKYEAEDIYSYVVPYFTHNDLLEIFAELGLIGFIPYALFIFLIFKINYSMIVRWFNSNDHLYLAFISLPLIIYFVDMNLNFPLDRPAIQIYLIIYILTIQLLEGESKKVQ